jgi:hypothetical protein
MATKLIKAAVARDHNEPLTVEDLELDDPRPNEVRVRLVATGICHTDAIARDGVYPRGALRCVLRSVQALPPGADGLLRTFSRRISVAVAATIDVASHSWRADLVALLRTGHPLQRTRTWSTRAWWPSTRTHRSS